MSKQRTKFPRAAVQQIAAWLKAEHNAAFEEAMVEDDSFSLYQLPAEVCIDMHGNARLLCEGQEHVV